MRCAEADAFIHAYVDGELAGLDRDSYEQHLLECDACSHACRLQGRFKAAVRGHLPRPAVPPVLRMRLEAAIATAPPIRRRWVWDAYPRMVPVAAAAAILIAILGAARTTHVPMVVEQARRAYNAALPMDVVDSDCASIANWFRGRVDFAIPTRLRHVGTCQGGRLVNVMDRFGAYIVYQEPNGHRLGMIVFSGEDDDLEGPRRRVVQGHDVYFGSGQGASTATFRDQDGLNYVVTSDVDEDSLGALIQAALSERR